jgi:hypothetical protein
LLNRSFLESTGVQAIGLHSLLSLAVLFFKLTSKARKAKKDLNLDALFALVVKNYNKDAYTFLT